MYIYIYIFIYIHIYKGEIITETEGIDREKIYEKLQSNFLFEMNRELWCDAKRKGNKVFIYVMHICVFIYMYKCIR
jgi:hypothetical protein